MHVISKTHENRCYQMNITGRAPHRIRRSQLPGPGPFLAPSAEQSTQRLSAHMQLNKCMNTGRLSQGGAPPSSPLSLCIKLNLYNPTRSLFNIHAPHFKGLKTDAQGGSVTCPRPHSLGMEFNPRQPDSQACAFSQGYVTSEQKRE